MIVYAVICRAKDAAILVEVSSPELGGNAPQVTTALLEHLRDHPDQLEDGQRKTYVQRNEVDLFAMFLESCSTYGLSSSTTTTTTDSSSSNFITSTSGTNEHYFHVWKTQSVIYCCLGDDNDMRSQKVNFAFLEHAQLEFTKQYSAARIAKANAYSMDKTFSKDLRSAMHYYNIHQATLGSDQKVQQILTQVEDLKVVMGRNLHLMLRRGENLDDLVAKSEKTQQEAQIFRKRANELKLLQRRAAMCSISTGMMLLVLYVLMVGFCGFHFEYCRARNNNNNNNNNNGGGGGGGYNNNNNNNDDNN